MSKIAYFGGFISQLVFTVSERTHETEVRLKLSQDSEILKKFCSVVYELQGTQNRSERRTVIYSKYGSRVRSILTWLGNTTVLPDVLDKQ